MDSESTIQDPGFWIQVTESRILNPELWIQNPEARNHHPESWISIQDSEFRFRIQVPESGYMIQIQDSES